MGRQMERVDGLAGAWSVTSPWACRLQPGGLGPRSTEVLSPSLSRGQERGTPPLPPEDSALIVPG